MQIIDELDIESVSTYPTSQNDWDRRSPSPYTPPICTSPAAYDSRFSKSLWLKLYYEF